MPIVDESKQNKGVNNNTQNKQMAINMEYQNRPNHPRFKSPYLGAKYQQRVTPIRTLNGAYAREVDSWNNNTSPIKALVNSGIGYALAPAAQTVYNMHKASPKKHVGVLSYIPTGVGYNTYGVKKINVDQGPHENYIRKIYPYIGIPVYENTKTLDFFTKKPMQKASNIINKTPWKGANNNLDFGDNGVDAAGHLVQEGTSNGKKVYRAQDIWKFNPDEYKQKWSSYDLGTPVIVKTPWLYR